MRQNPAATMRMLSAFRWELTGTQKENPKDLTLGQDGAEGVRRFCIDSRLDPRHSHMTGKETYFQASAAGAAVPPWQGGTGMDAQTVVDFGYPINYIENADTIIIEGHTHCGANAAMVNALIAGFAVNAVFETRWMLPMAPEGLEEALLKADAAGADRDEMLRLVEQVTVLQSIRNLYDYRFNDRDVRSLIDSGEIQVIGAIKDLAKDESDHQPLYVYDAEQGEFRDIRDIYKEMGSPTFEELEAARHTPTARAIGDVVDAEIVMQKGAISQTVAELSLENIDLAIKQKIEAIGSLGHER